MLRGVPTMVGANYIRVPARLPTFDYCLYELNMTDRRNIELKDLDPIDKKKLLDRLEAFQNGLPDLKRAAAGEEPLFSLEDEP